MRSEPAVIMERGNRIMGQAVRATFVPVMAVVVFFSVGTLAAQQAQPATPAHFEVAAIKPGNPRLGAFQRLRWGRLEVSFGW